MESDGFVVAWDSDGQDGSGLGVFARSFDSSGAAQGSEFQVAAYTSGPQFQPAVAAISDGAFVVSWQSGNDGYPPGVFGRRLVAGLPAGTEFQVNAYTTSSQATSDVAAIGAGRFVAAWGSYGQDGEAGGVFARGFIGGSVVLISEFQVNLHTSMAQDNAAVAANNTGRFVVAWASEAQDADQAGVFARVFQLATPLDVDGNGSLSALTDGLLVLRFAFGFTGAALVTNAVGAGCTRCDGASVAMYLAKAISLLDIDGDGVTVPLTDGLLILRYLFGFSGAALTAGAVDMDCSRCDATAIMEYLDALD